MNPETGLPELPENHFWRVYESGFSYIRVAIIKRDKVTMLGGLWRRYKEREVGFGAVDKNSCNPNSIRRAANRAMFGLEHDWATYLGDYPPKTLNK